MAAHERCDKSDSVVVMDGFGSRSDIVVVAPLEQFSTA
jgi:hypothetical protein